MVDSGILNYIRETLAKGYREEEIREALLKQGWYIEEIDEAIEVVKTSQPTGTPANPAGKPAVVKGSPAAGEKTKVRTQAVQEEKGSHPLGFTRLGFLLPVIGGVIILLNAVMVFSGIGDILGLVMPGLNVSIISMAGLPLSTLDTFMINVIIGGFLLASAYIILTMPDKVRITGIFIAVLSFISLMAGNGFLIGSVIAIAGGIMACLNK